MLATIANAVAETGEYEVTVVTAFNEGRPDYFAFDDSVARVDLGIRRSDMAAKAVKAEYKKRLTEWLTHNLQDVAVSLGSLEFFFLTGIKDGSRKMFWFHFAFNYYIQTCRRTPWAWANRLIGRMTQMRIVRVARRYDRVVVLSKADLKTWRRYLSNVTQIYNPLTITPKGSPDYGVHRAIAVGRIERQKGFDYLVEAWRTVHEQYPDWRLDIYGGGEEGDIRRLQQQIDDSGLTGVVTLCGRTADIAAEYSRHSLMILSSRYEGFGLVLVEASACGLPMVSFDCEQGPAEIITHGRDGYLVSPVGNTRGLADAICRLCGDESLRRSMGEAAREASERFTIDKITEEWRNSLSPF